MISEPTRLKPVGEVDGIAREIAGQVHSDNGSIRDPARELAFQPGGRRCPPWAAPASNGLRSQHAFGWVEQSALQAFGRDAAVGLNAH